MQNVIVTFSSAALDRTIGMLCPLIESEFDSNSTADWSEESLRRELVACILGSQVRLEMASSALHRLEKAGLLGNDWWQKTSGCYESAVFESLSGIVGGKLVESSYRFPRARAKQLADARVATIRDPLKRRLAAPIEARQLRQNLVSDIPGLGPKQASMFLRNVGRSYDLAILDTHVLRFLVTRRSVPAKANALGTIRAYEKVEKIFADYAKTLGYRVGYLDWAVWATMRAAQELRV